ncbi:MAG: DDE-type integrase/transposase/recombinase [Dehalococcoidales bacterium]|nr:DDE-type integrase/transposase/recombinase [Dehalococcoidales bacterium]
MTFIRAKEIPPHSGNWYDYEVKTIHEGEKVIQKHIRYIGKSSRTSIPTGSRPSVDTRSNVAIVDAPKIKKQSEPKVACKLCHSQNTRKYGLYKGIQNYYCNDCHTKFIGTDALSYGRVSPSYIASALNEYYNGMSFHDIEGNIDQLTDDDISHTAIIKWVDKFTNKAIRETRDLHPKVGDTWIADETYFQTDVKVKDPKGVVFWDIIDAKTRFLLATIITTSRNKQDARRLMELAAKRAGKEPKVIVTDKLAAYIDGIELAYGSDTTHRQGGPFKYKTSGKSTALIERFHNTLKERTKVMRDLRDKSTLKRFTDGWLVHYNFFRPNVAMDNKTPATMAGLNYDCQDWADVVGYEKEPIVKPLEQESA